MRIGFIGKGTPSAFKEHFTGETDETSADVFLFAFDGQREVSYEKELRGDTHFFEDAALLSKSAQNVVICGCVTDTRGHKRKSAVVAENGRLIGVSDMLNAIDGEVGSGATLRVYDTKIGRIGVAVAEDLLFPEVIRSLAVCGSDIIVCPYGKAGNVQSVLLRAHAYCYGVPIAFCGEGYCMLADVSGTLAFASPQSPAVAELKITKEYHLVETRKKGLRR